jgi:hypothetical protein
MRRVRLRGNASPALFWLVVWAAVILLLVAARLLSVR